MNDLISHIERGEVVAAEVVNGSLTKLVPDFNKTAELLRLIRNPWIPVTPETMPEDGQRIIVCDTECGVGVGKYRQGISLRGKTHWMPLPALPEQEGR